MKTFAQRSLRFQRNSERFWMWVSMVIWGTFVLVAISFLFGVFLAAVQALLGTN